MLEEDSVFSLDPFMIVSWWPLMQFLQKVRGFDAEIGIWNWNTIRCLEMLWRMIKATSPLPLFYKKCEID